MRLIDADYILSALNVFYDRKHGNEHFLLGIETAQDIVKGVPTIEPKPQWIPVTESLPECGKHYVSNDVLVSVDYRPDDPEETEDTFVSIDHVCFNCFKQGVFSIERDNPYNNEPSPYFVTAWMPLPEPYTPAGEEENT